MNKHAVTRRQDDIASDTAVRTTFHFLPRTVLPRSAGARDSNDPQLTENWSTIRKMQRPLPTLRRTRCGGDRRAQFHDGGQTALTVLPAVPTFGSSPVATDPDPSGTAHHTRSLCELPALLRPPP